MHRLTAAESAREATAPRRSAVLLGILTLLLALVPAAGVGAQDGPSEPRPIDAFCPEDMESAGYPDTAGNEHERAIDCVSAYEIAQGKSDGRYAPAERVNRAQMASFVARFLEVFADDYGYEMPQDPDNHFSDVDPDSEHGMAINQLAELDVVSGYPDGEYKGHRRVRRDQMASFLNNAIGVATGQPIQTDEDFFDDDDGNAHEDNINGIASVGIAVGDGMGSYSPARRVRRDQMASFIARTGDYLTVSGFSTVDFVLMTGYEEVDDSGETVEWAVGNRDMLAGALLGLNSDDGTVCVTLFFVDGNDSPYTGFHIHEARMGANGGIVVPLPEPDEEGFVDDCVEADPETVAAIEDDPAGYYLNLHTEDFEAGAARGQLAVTQMLTYLSWAFEVDDSGDQIEFGQGQPDTSAVSLLLVDTDTGEVCSFIAVDGDGPFTGFHIHDGTMDENGDIVVGFTEPDDETGEVGQCTDVGTNMATELAANRDAYYLNVHTEDFPAGAARSQLDSGTLVVPLSGEDEVDEGGYGAGETGATGTAYVQVTFLSPELCHFTVTDATPPFTGMHIHEGARDENGPIVVGFTPPDDETGEVSECVDVDPEMAFELIFNPEAYYWNVHTEDYPAGAVRGQLVDGEVF